MQTLHYEELSNEPARLSLSRLGVPNSYWATWLDRPARSIFQICECPKNYSRLWSVSSIMYLISKHLKSINKIPLNPKKFL